MKKPVQPPRLLDRRDEFLINLYNQLMEDINRHIMVVWQSIAAIVAAAALFTIPDNKLPLYVSTGVIIIVCIWHVLHAYDGNYWYNRNLVIIANIERQFLVESDVKDIHPYFAKHRDTGSLLTHMKIQIGLGVALGMSAWFYQITEFFPKLLDNSAGPLDFIPSLLVVGGLVFWSAARDYYDRKYETFVKLAPGKAVDASGISFGTSHGKSAPHS